MTDTYTLTLTFEERGLLIKAMIEIMREMVREGYSVTEIREWNERIEMIEKINPQQQGDQK